MEKQVTVGERTWTRAPPLALYSTPCTSPSVARASCFLSPWNSTIEFLFMLSSGLTSGVSSGAAFICLWRIATVVAKLLCGMSGDSVQPNMGRVQQRATMGHLL